MMNIQEITTTLTLWQQDESLWVATNLAARMKALADVAWAQEVVRLRGRHEDWTAVAQQAAMLQRELDGINGHLFRQIRQKIQTGHYDTAALRLLFNQFTDYAPEAPPQRHIGEDGLDVLLNGILQVDVLPEPTQVPTADMVHLEVTPARAILDMIDQVPLGIDDVFYDLGSGLGHVALLVAWLTGVQVRGVEIDPGYCQRARQLAAAFKVENVQFLAEDARTAVYDDGTIFFMFTPFTGPMLQAVLARLQAEAARRPITLCTYGTVTLDVAEMPSWHCWQPERLDAFKLCIFRHDLESG